MNGKHLFVIGSGRKSFHYETSGFGFRSKQEGKTLLNAENMLFYVCLSFFSGDNIGFTAKIAS